MIKYIKRFFSKPIYTRLPDGSGFAIASFPLPKDHWLYEDKENDSPMPLRCGVDDKMRPHIVAAIKGSARYAIRASTMNGKEKDFDPDAMVQNMIVGLVGYFTPDGTSSTSSLTDIGVCGD